MQITTLYILFILFLNLATCVLVYIYNFHGTAVLFNPVSNSDYLFTLLIFIFIGYIILFIYINKTLYLRKPYTIKYSIDILNLIFFIILIFNFLIFFLFGIGTAGSSNQKFGFLLNMLPTNILTVIYFCLINY